MMKSATVARRFLALLILTVVGSTMSNAGLPQAPEFFKVEDNLTKIRWAHAVNKLEDLNNTLKNPDIHMIEADVSLIDNVPTMAHPGQAHENFTLEQFMATVNSTKDLKKGIKLDFKETEVLAPSMEIVRKYLTTLQVPLWLNADILPSSSSSKYKEVDGKTLIDLTSTIQGAVISLGWTTGGCVGNYSVDDVEKMKSQHPNNITVTYAVRACLAADTASETFAKALDQTPKSTLTIWSSADDELEADKLSEFIKAIGPKRIYLDVPDELRKKLSIPNGAGQLLIQSPLMVLTVILSALSAFKMF